MNLQMVTTTDIQRGFGKFLDDLTEPVIVMRDSRPAAVVLNYEEYIQIERIRKTEKVAALEKMLDRIHAQNAHIAAAEVKKDVKAAIKYVRSRR